MYWNENSWERLPISTNEIEKREVKDKYWISAPFIEILCLLTFPIYIFFEFYNMKSTNQDFKNLLFSNYHYLFFFLPLTIIFLTYCYLTLLCAIRNHLFKIFLFVTIAILTGYSAALILFCGPIGLFLAIVVVSIFVIWYFCLKRNIKLAALTTKEALEVLSHIKGRVVISMSKIIFLYGFLVAFLIITGIMALDLQCFYAKSEEYESKEMLKYLISLSAMGYFFFVGTCLAVLYLFGAAIFNQKSLQDNSYSSGLGLPIGNRESNCEPVRFFDQAEDIAFRSSLGVACFGSFILSAVGWLRSLVSSSSNNTRRGVSIVSLLIISVLLPIIRLIERFLAFFSSSAYIYSAIYGTSFIESGKMGWNSFQNKGLERYFSFSIVERILGVTSFIFSLTVSIGIMVLSFMIAIGALSTNLTDEDYFILRIQIIFCICLFASINSACLFTNQLVGGASTCQLSVYVEDPLRFRNTYSDLQKFKESIGDEIE